MSEYVDSEALPRVGLFRSAMHIVYHIYLALGYKCDGGHTWVAPEDTTYRVGSSGVHTEESPGCPRPDKTTAQ